MNLELTGKVALVTGASRGIGKAVALELAREGADVAICSRQQGPLDEAAADIAKQTGRRIVAVPGDTGDGASVKAVVERTLATFGRIDILVNNAAKPGGMVREFASATEELMMGDINTKILGYFRFAKAVVPIMQKNGYGRIINIGGMSGRLSKNISGLRNAAVAHMTKSLCYQVGKDGITVNMIHPGATRTERTDAAGVERGVTRSAIRRIVDASEIGYLVCFLASPKAGAITGTVMDCAGGYVNPIFGPGSEGA